MSHRLIIVGSPRPSGRSAALADELFQACIEECPDDGVSILSVASLTIGGCIACDTCEKPSSSERMLPEEGDPLYPHPFAQKSDAWCHRCIFDDDMDEVRKHLDAADELIVVTPIYFSGVPSQLKALLDRLQPYYWSDMRKIGKRPLRVHLVGEGGDPHGVKPALGVLKSALAVAGFRLETVLDWRGRISSDGEILEDAEIHEYH